MERRIHWIQVIRNSTLFIADQPNIVARDCTNTTIDSDNCGVLKFKYVIEHECVCKGELCNAGPTVKAVSKITLALLVMSLYVVTLFCS